MKMRNLLFATAAASLAAAPVASQARLAERTSQPVSAESELGGHGIGPALIIVAIAAAGMIALLVTDEDDEDPISV